MPTALRIRQLDDGRWIPDHPEIADLTYFIDPNQPDLPLKVIREALFASIEHAVPGQYTLDPTADDLASLRQVCFDRIDARSRELIELGFEHRGVTFSLSLGAQTRYTAMLATTSLVLGYPILINSLDDTAVIPLRNLIELQAFCGGALNKVRSIIDAGTAQKNMIRAETSPTKLFAYEDPR